MNPKSKYPRSILRPAIASVFVAVFSPTFPAGAGDGKAGISKGTVARAAAYVRNKEIRKKLTELMIPTFQMERVRVKYLPAPPKEKV